MVEAVDVLLLLLLLLLLAVAVVGRQLLLLDDLAWPVVVEAALAAGFLASAALAALAAFLPISRYYVGRDEGGEAGNTNTEMMADGSRFAEGAGKE